MHRFTLIQGLLFGLSTASQISARDNSSSYDSSLNFRPDWVSGLDNVYHWVGSYYNATTRLEYTPYAGVASSANDTPYTCPHIRDKTYTLEFNSILAVTETSKYNAGDNPVNLFYFAWPQNTELNTSWPIGQMSSDYWGLLSSTPVYSYNSSSHKADTNFNITLQNTQSAPYNLSSMLTDYAGLSSVIFNMTGCNSTETTRWAGDFISLGIEDDNIGYNWTYPNPVLDVRFDGKTANLTVEGYFEGVPFGRSDFNEDGLFVPGKVKLSFSGVIDTYHSDVLVNDSAIPSWERSIGFGNDSANIGYNGTDTSASNVLPSSGSWSILGLAMMLSIASYSL